MRKICWIVVLTMVVAAAGVGGSAKTRVDLLQHTPEAVSVADKVIVWHGWTVWASTLEEEGYGWSAKEVERFIVDLGWAFSLYVDGIPQGPVKTRCFADKAYYPATGQIEKCWRYAWVFEFAKGELEEGLHHFEGEWTGFLHWEVDHWVEFLP